MAKIIKFDGETIEVKPENGTDFSLEELQEIVGGYIETVPTYKRGEILVVNEEGKLLGLPFNREATVLARIYNDYIAGDALLCKEDEVR
jgi:hypothetical protein